VHTGVSWVVHRRNRAAWAEWPFFAHIKLGGEFRLDVIADPALDLGNRHGRLAAGGHPTGAVADLEGLAGLGSRAALEGVQSDPVVLTSPTLTASRARITACFETLRSVPYVAADGRPYLLST
jgi:hypothetical protein